MRRKVRAKVESGTCNVCSAPCSSCMHRKLSCMEAKDDGSSDETIHATATSQNSNNEVDVSHFKRGACDGSQLAASEASNLLSAHSSHDSLSENADSKAHLKCLDTVNASVESDMLLKLPIDGTVGVDKLSPKQQCTSNETTLSNKNVYPKVVEGHDDNISCVSRVDDANLTENHLNKNVERKNLSCNVALGSNLESEGTGKVLIIPKPELLETTSNDEHIGGGLSNVQSRCVLPNTNGAHLEEDVKVDMLNVSSQPLPKLEAETKSNNGDPIDETTKSSVKVDQDEKLNQSVDLPDPQAVSGDESDESDIVEHDVKVCDICGDAGREDLLAICSKCADGAEHTYCMKEMLRKVPEGDWLCEECKLAEEIENQRQGSDAEGRKCNKPNALGSVKRHLETIEVTSASKRLAVETSPKLSSPSKMAALSRDSSFKGIDKGKAKPSVQINHSIIDTPENTRPYAIGSRLQAPKSTLLKSNSFSTINSKPKVKLVDEVPQKQKGTKESSCLDVKEGVSRTMKKSMSFRSVSSCRSSATEMKAKLLSSKFSQAQDMKPLKQPKDRSAFESKTLPKLDRPLPTPGTTNSHSSSLKVNQKLTPRGESAMVSSISYIKDSKASQSDGKLGGLRSTSSVGRKFAEIPVTTARSSAMNGMAGASVEQKLNQVSPKDEPSSSSAWTVERQSCNVDENLQDSVSRPRDLANQTEKIRESSVARLRPPMTAGSKSMTCQKCKEIGHSAEFCTVLCSARPSGIDISASRSVRDDMSKSNVTSEIASHDRFSVSNKLRNSDEGTDEGQANIDLSSYENYKQTNINNVKQPVMNSSDIVCPSKVGEDSMACSSGKPRPSLIATPLLSKMLTIPEHEYIWQGVFEVRRGGRLLDLHTGIQAHLSTCASPKVLEVMNQFPQKITVDEVPRLSTWPRQFHEHGAKEDNIALYFFAKDIESYEKNYKNLLDNMIKRDSALKGYVDGVEFLIFPSTQLPENSQRWNMLFFLWGVFRGKKSNCSDSVTRSVSSPNVVPMDINANDKPCNSMNGDLDKASTSHSNLEQHGARLDSKSLAKNATGSILSCTEIRCTNPSEEKIAAVSDCRLDAEHKLSTQAMGSNNGSSSREETKLHVDASGVREISTSPKVLQAGNHDESSVASVCEEKIVDMMDIDKNVVKVERNLNEDSTSMDTGSGRDLTVKGLESWQSHSRKRPFLDLSEAPPQTSSSIGPKLPWDIVDEENGIGIGKKLKSGLSEPCTSSSNAREGSCVSDGFASQMRNLRSSCSVEEDQAPDEKVILEDIGTAERYFFPVDSRRVKDFRLGGSNSMPWKEYSSNDEDQFHEGVPNLELALGAETKPPNKGMLPFFVETVEKNNNDKSWEKKVTNKEEEDGVSASLSLSLSFPFPDKEQTVKPVSKSEQLLPERPHVNTSLLLFGGFLDK